jgi:hypothetical protein
MDLEEIKEKTAIRIKQLISEISNGKSPEDATKSIQKDIIGEYIPGISNLPKEGKLHFDRYGNGIRLFPDGSTVDLTDKDIEGGRNPHFDIVVKGKK